MSTQTVSLRHATPADRTLITDFLNENWGSRHPLINLPDLFEYYYTTPDTLQFALAFSGDSLAAVAGYILANRSAQQDAWVSIWCAAKGCNGVGLELMEALPRLAGVRVLACNNIRPKTMAFYRFLGWHAGRIPHYYRLGAKGDFRLVQNAGAAHRLPAEGGLTLTPVAEADALAALGVPETGLLPQKDEWYLRRRYFEFPRQKYSVWAALRSGAAVAYLVTRTVRVEEEKATVLRIVDHIGAPDTLPALGKAIDELMRRENAEYADCYCAGLSPELLARAGFSERKEDDAIVIPNYLDPPLLQNTEYYYFTNHPENFVMFKADGDQDRPNLG